jgi:hypothetical protein
MPLNANCENDFFGTSESLEDAIGEDHGQEQVAFLPVYTDAASIMATGIQVAGQVKLTENSWCIGDDGGFYEMLLTEPRRQEPHHPRNKQEDSMMSSTVSVVGRASPEMIFKDENMVHKYHSSPTHDPFSRETRFETEGTRHHANSPLSSSYDIPSGVFPAASITSTPGDVRTETTLMFPASIYQSGQWYERFRDLVEFQKRHGHCLVPHNFKDNPPLAQWVKRQRYQYQVKATGKHSTLCEDRQAALEQLGYVWEAHRAIWEERLQELIEYKEANGHCNVPTNYAENRQLAIWVKCQRRQFKLFRTGRTSNLVLERMELLTGLGFSWNPRNLK